MHRLSRMSSNGMRFQITGKSQPSRTYNSALLTLVVTSSMFDTNAPTTKLIATTGRNPRAAPSSAASAKPKATIAPATAPINST